jgi:hypothetical protein
MRKSALLSAVILLVSTSVYSQISPYSITPQWRFGVNAGLNFPTGNYPTSGAPSATAAASNPGTDFIEASTSISDQTGTVAIYTNTMDARNVTNGIVRNLRPAGDNTCAGSATGGGVAIPDPASPTDTYYLFIANDVTGGACGARGINYYRFQKNGLGQAVYLSGPTLLTPSTFADESIAAGNDGQGNYWIVAHSYTSNVFRVWKVTASGISAPTDYTKAESSPNVNGNQSYSKISHCQDKIAWSGGGTMLIYEFNRTTGAIGNLLRSRTGVLHGVGLEFSNNGQYLYYSGQGTTVNWIEIATGTIGSVAGSASWSMQMGPDGKIYTSPSSSSTLGIIDNPNAPSTTTYGSISISPGSVYRGLINLAWLNPNLPVINHSGTCSVTFSFDFTTYFGGNIAVNNASIEWDFGDGVWRSGLGANPTWNYSSSASHTVNLRFNDGTCGHQWTATKNISTSCPAPVKFLNISAVCADYGNIISWKAIEKDNDYFEVQRSDDGIHFYTIGTVKGSGTTSSATHYEFRDINKNTGTCYYRIIQHDIDGKYSNSNIVSLEGNDLKLVIKNNPSSSDFSVSIANGINYVATVTDILGRIIYSTVLTEENSEINFGNTFPSGTYLLTVRGQEKIFIEKLIKE